MIESICICGAGTMGSGIAQVAASRGIETILYDLNQVVVDRAKTTIGANLQKGVEKNKITADAKNKTLEKIHFTTSLHDCMAAVIIEAVIEQLEVKWKLFNDLAAINNLQTILATNTSSLSVTAISEKIASPERVIGMHFFNPAPLMKLVEVVATSQTDPQVVEKIMSLAKFLGKTPVRCNDGPGFIVNHVARPYYLEALYLAEKGKTDFETIDRLMEASGFKMGPFRLMDLIGNDVNYAVTRSVYEAMGRPARLAPSWIQEEKVQKGELGKKTGKGYYEY